MMKWGFGMAPISKVMRERYDAAVDTLVRFCKGGELTLDDMSMISEFKGMCNRCLRKDQWDWFSVYTELGTPAKEQLTRIVSELTNLRKSIQENDRDEIGTHKRRLLAFDLVKILQAYRGMNRNEPGGFVYVLSTREHPDILKIGMTTRSVIERTKEINGATGVVVPYGARYAVQVNDPKLAEKTIHDDLSDYRIRKDREFFQIPFVDAVKRIRRIVEGLSIN